MMCCQLVHAVTIIIIILGSCDTKHHQQAPVLYMKPVNTSVEVGHRVTLACAAHGYQPWITWLNATGNVVFRKGGRISLTSPNRFLKFRPAAAEDEGWYMCVANNYYGYMYSDYIYLTVIVPAHITRGPQSQTVHSNTMVNLSCTAEGNPTPQHTWVEDSNMLMFPGKSTGDVISVWVTETVEIMCYVTNTYGRQVFADMTKALITVDDDIVVFGDNDLISFVNTITVTDETVFVETKKSPNNMMKYVGLVMLFGVGLLLGALGLSIYIIQRRCKKRAILRTPCDEVIELPILNPRHDNECRQGIGLKQYPRRYILKGDYVSSGHFSFVYTARVKGLHKTIVAVKELKIDLDPCTDPDTIVKAYENECAILAKVTHPNVVRALGMCCVGGYSVILEHIPDRDLKHFLKKHQQSPLSEEQGPVVPLAVGDLLSFSAQIAAGLTYLTRLEIIHCDLAARNCLVSRCCEVEGRRRFVIKISDFGLSVDLSDADDSVFYLDLDKLYLPIRTLPPEAIVQGMFSTCSDVWAYGVLVWEIFSMGYKPYYGMTLQEVCEYVGSHRTLSCPELAPEMLYTDVMLRCWEWTPTDRLSFTFIEDILATIII